MYYLILSVISIYVVHLYKQNLIRICKSRKTLDGKTVLVTGGTSGLGLQAAVNFAQRGAKIIIACPFDDEGNAAKREIEATTKSHKVTFKHLDLSSLASVREFARDILNTEDRLDILVNNAGVGTAGDFSTADGMSFIMQVNFYGHFLLTLLLLPLLKKTGTPTERSRIVNISSIMHRLATSDVTKYNKTGHFWFQFLIYSNSKFSFVLFARELAKKMEGFDVVVNCVDPGFVATRIYDSVCTLFGVVVNALIHLLYKNEGIETLMHVALDEKAGEVSGEFFKNCQLCRPRRMAYDDNKAGALWEESVKLVKISDEELKCVFS